MPLRVYEGQTAAETQGGYCFKWYFVVQNTHCLSQRYTPGRPGTANLWVRVNSWLHSPVSAHGADSAWAGGQRYGVVLWSSGVDSSFEELLVQSEPHWHATPM